MKESNEEEVNKLMESLDLIENQIKKINKSIDEIIKIKGEHPSNQHLIECKNILKDLLIELLVNIIDKQSKEEIEEENKNGFSLNN